MNDMSREFIYRLLNAQHDYAEEAIKTFQERKKKIYIFCAGVAGKLIQSNLEHFGISVYRFVDNDAKKIGTEVNGIPVISFQELTADTAPKIIVVGTVAFHDEIVCQCLDGGISLEEICFADFLHYEIKETTRNYFLENIDAIINIFDRCVDEESKDLFITNLLYQFTRDRRHYQGRLAPLFQQYYEPDIIQLGEDEVYFDCGAKDGDTALAFHSLRNGKYKKIIAFEPDRKNFELLKENLAQLTKVENINAGVGETEDVLAFNGNIGGHSSFSSSGELQAQVVPLDRYIKEKPTLIKMDIEGFELSALKGARQILNQCQPKLAICVYHKPCDIVELPKYILEQNGNYKLFFRLYRNFGHDLVCYCV